MRALYGTKHTRLTCPVIHTICMHIRIHIHGSSHACEKEVKVDITAVALQRYGLVVPDVNANHTALHVTLTCDIGVFRETRTMGTW